MPISASFAWAARVSALLPLLLGCAPPAPPPPAAATQATPREALPLGRAVDVLADAMLARAGQGAPRQVVIDPLIDRATGAETRATRAIGRQLATRVAARPGLSLRPFTPEALEARPIVLLGAITGVTAPGSLQNSQGEPGAYRFWAVLADLASGEIIAHENVWVDRATVDPTSSPFHADSPVWLPDRATAAYLRVCAGNPGQPIDAAWLAGLRAEALLDAATLAYEGGRPDAALALFEAADQAHPAGRLRGLNGRYLSASALGRVRAAEAAFGDLVDYGLEQRNLGVKFLFQVARTEFWPDPAISGRYPMWLRQIARRTAARETCLLILGHASPTGDEPRNEQLSLARARRIAAELALRAAPLRQRTETEGRGSREPIVGNRRDDATDALDRRVAFVPRPCRGIAAG